MGRTNPSAANNTAAFSQLQAENDALKKENRDLRQKLERMNELLLNAQRARFGSSSEKQDYVMPNQVGIFNEAEAEQDPKAPEPTEETILVPAHTAAGTPGKDLGARRSCSVPRHHGQLGHSDGTDLAEAAIPHAEEGIARQQYHLCG